MKDVILIMLNRVCRAMLSNSKDPLRKLLVKAPKNVIVDESSGILAALFERSKKSPTYLLLKELFAYLQQSPLLAQEFPFLKSDTRFEQNWMALHLQMLKGRLVHKNLISAINELQLETFNYNAQVYFFPSYAHYLNPQTPADYASHFAQAYLKRLLLFDTRFLEEYEASPSEDALKRLLRLLVYEHRVSEGDSQLAKLGRYYLAHRRYLDMLSWGDLVQHRIRWGFEGQRSLLS